MMTVTGRVEGPSTLEGSMRVTLSSWLVCSVDDWENMNPGSPPSASCGRSSWHQLRPVPCNSHLSPLTTAAISQHRTNCTSRPASVATSGLSLGLQSLQRNMSLQRALKQSQKQLDRHVCVYMTSYALWPFFSLSPSVLFLSLLCARALHHVTPSRVLSFCSSHARVPRRAPARNARR